MKAAVVTSFEAPPRYADFPEPVVEAPHQLRIDVLAAPLHHLAMARATGKHYSATAKPPLVPGFDGVGRDAEGRLRYFVLGDTRFGSCAERTVVEEPRSFVLPEGADPVAIAAGMNAGMAGWLALRRRVPFEKGQSVLVLGATGSSGTMAVQVARLFGASRIVATGRNPQRLAALGALGATDVVPLGDPRLGELARDVDVVLDFVWGEVAVRVMESILRARSDHGHDLTWINIGSMAGATAPVPAALVRAARFQILGSGIGSVSAREIAAELPALAQAIAQGTLRLDAEAVPLADVERAWAEAQRSTTRLVLTP